MKEHTDQQLDCATEDSDHRPITEAGSGAPVEQDLLLTKFTIDHASDAVYWIEESSRFVYVNEAACKALEYTRDELLGMGVGDIDPVFPMDQWLEIWEQNKARGSFTFETLHKTKHGRVFPVEITTNFIGYAGQSLNCAYARDITERKQAEDALRKTNRTLATLSRVNEILVRATVESELLQQVVPAYTEPQWPCLSALLIASPMPDMNSDSVSSLSP